MRGRLARGVAFAALLLQPLAGVAGDAARGERVFQYCYACHSVDPGETNLQGPNLAGIVGRPIAAQDGYEYSPAMRAFAAREKVWSEELLDRYIAAPDAVVPRTTMEFHGLEEASERAGLIAYLRSIRRP